MQQEHQTPNFSLLSSILQIFHQVNKMTKQYVQLWKSNINNDNDINEDNSSNNKLNVKQ